MKWESAQASIARGASMLLCALVLIGLTLQFSSADEDALGSPDWSPWLASPSPGACTVAALTTDQVIEAVAAARFVPAGESARAQVTSLAELPPGQPATPREAAGALDALTMVVACYNAGNLGALLALFTEQGLAQLLLGSDIPLRSMAKHEIIEAVEFLGPLIEGPATPVPAGDRIRLTEIQDVLLLDDGRVLVTATGISTVGDGPAYFVLRDGEQGWRIDAAGTIAPNVEATPVP